jgi:hypothetical protein
MVLPPGEYVILCEQLNNTANTEFIISAYFSTDDKASQGCVAFEQVRGFAVV